MGSYKKSHTERLMIAPDILAQFGLQPTIVLNFDGSVPPVTASIRASNDTVKNDVSMQRARFLKDCFEGLYQYRLSGSSTAEDDRWRLAKPFMNDGRKDPMFMLVLLDQRFDNITGYHVDVMKVDPRGLRRVEGAIDL